jgi:hypothetical protein
MNAIHHISAGERYARCIQTSKRVRWDVDEDVIRGRHFDAAQKFLPDGLSIGRRQLRCFNGALTSFRSCSCQLDRSAKIFLRRSAWPNTAKTPCQPGSKDKSDLPHGGRTGPQTQGLRR